MNIIIANRRTARETLNARHQGFRIVDLTSRAVDQFVQFSPFFPHGNIPVPYSPGQTAQSVEGIWQGLKVFEKQGVDLNSFNNTTMKSLKRTQRKFGTCLGHQKGIFGTELLPYLEARKGIYLPVYRWVLVNKVYPLLKHLKDLSREVGVILLDYETNSEVENLSRPLSHASLVKAFLEYME